jgi:hypothetical protein
MEVHFRALESHPEALKAHPGAMKAQPDTMVDYPRAMEAHPGTMETRMSNPISNNYFSGTIVPENSYPLPTSMLIPDTV